MTPPAVVSMLVDHALLDSATILDAGIVVDDRQGLGTTFRVQAGDRRTLIVKAAARGREDWQRREAATLAALVREPELVSVLPAVVAVDVEAGIVVMEATRGARTLREVFAEHGAIPADLAAALGGALARVHAAPLGAAGGAASSPPWQLGLALPDLALYRIASSASLALIETLQAHPAFDRALDELRTGWRATSIVHHDLRWDNVVVSGDVPGRPAAVTLIDWEHARPGDPAWDLGTLFGEFLNGWLAALDAPASSDVPARRQQALAVLHPAIRALWSSYATGRALDGAAAAAVLGRAARYAAVWVAGSRFERLRAEQALAASDLRALQLALNILERTGEALAFVLGLLAPAERAGR